MKARKIVTRTTDKPQARSRRRKNRCRFDDPGMLDFIRGKVLASAKAAVDAAASGDLDARKALEDAASTLENLAVEVANQKNNSVARGRELLHFVHAQPGTSNVLVGAPTEQADVRNYNWILSLMGLFWENFWDRYHGSKSRLRRLAVAATDIASAPDLDAFKSSCQPPCLLGMEPVWDSEYVRSFETSLNCIRILLKARRAGNQSCSSRLWQLAALATELANTQLPPLTDHVITEASGQTTSKTRTPTAAELQKWFDLPSEPPTAPGSPAAS